jgi:hypothetical protein
MFPSADSLRKGVTRYHDGYEILARNTPGKVEFHGVENVSEGNDPATDSASHRDRLS